MRELLSTIESNQLRLMLGGVAFLIGAALLSYLLVPQAKTYYKTMQSRSSLQTLVADGGELADELQKQQTTIDRLRQQMHGDTTNMPAEKLEAYIMGQLQVIAWKRNVELVSVRPSSGQLVHKFREILFDVELNGDYFAVYDWLQDVGAKLGFIVVNLFEMEPQQLGKLNSPLKVKFTMVSYRSVKPT